MGELGGGWDLLPRPIRPREMPHCRLPSPGASCATVTTDFSPEARLRTSKHLGVSGVLLRGPSPDHHDLWKPPEVEWEAFPQLSTPGHDSTSLPRRPTGTTTLWAPPLCGTSPPSLHKVLLTLDWETLISMRGCRREETGWANPISSCPLMSVSFYRCAICKLSDMQVL